MVPCFSASVCLPSCSRNAYVIAQIKDKEWPIQWQVLRAHGRELLDDSAFLNAYVKDLTVVELVIQPSPKHH